MFFLCAGAAVPSQAKAKAKATAKAKSKVKATIKATPKASAVTTPKAKSKVKAKSKATPSKKQGAKIIKSIKKGKAVEKEDANDTQDTIVVLDGKEIKISRKDRREHASMLQSSQAIN